MFSTMRTRQILFLSCAPWPSVPVTDFDKTSSTWGPSTHFTRHRVQPSHRRVRKWFGRDFMVHSVALVAVALVDSC